MADIIQFADRRNARIRDRLLGFAVKGESVILETPSGAIRADRMLCRENTVDILTSWTDRVSIRLEDVRDVKPAPNTQFSSVNASGDFVTPWGFNPKPQSSCVLAFGRPGRRR